MYVVAIVANHGSAQGMARLAEVIRDGPVATCAEADGIVEGPTGGILNRKRAPRAASDVRLPRPVTEFAVTRGVCPVEPIPLVRGAAPVMAGQTGVGAHLPRLRTTQQSAGYGQYKEGKPDGRGMAATKEPERDSRVLFLRPPRCLMVFHPLPHSAPVGADFSQSAG